MIMGCPVLERARLQRWRLTEEARRSRGRCGAQQRRRLGERGRGLGGGGRGRTVSSV